jgi:hypothetical protein
MITVNLNEERLLKYKINDIEKVKRSSLNITFPNHVVYRFEGSSNIPTSEIYVKLPILKNVIKSPVEAECYLEIGDDTRYFKVAVDSISFEFAPTVQIQFQKSEEPIEATLLTKNEVTLDRESIQLKKVGYKKSKKGSTT